MESRATPAAARGFRRAPAALAPGVGHLVHMPAHIYVRVGRYHDAVLANVAAVDADRRYAALTQPDPQYVAGYVVHNQHFLWAAAFWSGESALALSTAESRRGRRCPRSERVDAGTRQHLMGLPWLTDVRFGALGCRSSRGRSPREGAYLQGLAAYARGTAYARTGDVVRAERELTALRAARRTAGARKLKIKNTNRAADVLALAEVAVARRAGRRPAPLARSLRHAKNAVKRERALESDEPPVWPIAGAAGAWPHAAAAGAPRAALDAYRP